MISDIRRTLPKRIIAIIIVGLILNVLFCGYDASDYVYAATVNKSNGNCAYITRKNGVQIHIFDLKYCTTLTISLGDEYTKGGVATIWFDETYKVYCYRSNLCLYLDNAGNIIDSIEMSDEEVPVALSEWEKQGGVYTYTWNGYEYRYYNSNYFKSRFLGDDKYLYICDNEGSIICIWKSCD